jgi:hypothetical protein
MFPLLCQRRSKHGPFTGEKYQSLVDIAKQCDLAISSRL